MHGGVVTLRAILLSGRTMVSIGDHDGAVKIFVAYAFLRAVSFGIYAAQVPCLRLKFSYAFGSSVELNSLSGICIMICYIAVLISAAHITMI